MKRFAFKRFLALILVVMMTITSVPLNALAHDHEEVTENGVLDSVENKPFEETVLLKQIKADIADLLNKYLGTITMSEDDVKAAVSNMDEETQSEAFDEVCEIIMAVEELTDAEGYFLEHYEGTETFGYLFNTLYDVLGYDEIGLYAASGSHTPVTGVTVGVSGATDNSMSSGAVTVTAKGSGGVFGIGASAKTATITVYNESDATSEISFDWTATSVNQLKIDGKVESGTSGSFSKVLDAGGSITITITTAKNSTVNKLVMKNFAIVAAQTESNVTFDYDSTLGSITVGGNKVADGNSVKISKEGTTVVATPASGATFIAWIDTADHSIISNEKSCTLKPTADMTVAAVFTTADSNAWFLVNGNTLYEGLDAAMAAVANVSNKTVVIAANGTLPAGDYTIPAGVTLLIPKDANNAVYATPPYLDSNTKPTAYRTLTMASGAHITVNGVINLAGSQFGSAPYAGLTVGPVGFIKMSDDSSITVNSGAKLYAWGYITGSGSVVVENGGTVYEHFQVASWRGGSFTSSMVGNKQRVFPMTQYYVQNIEVPMTLKAGAIENGYMSVNISLIGVQGSEVPFIGPNGMFNVASGYIVKDYDESSDRLEISINGQIQMKSLSISMKLGAIGTKTINSKDYELPVTSNLTVEVNGGSRVDITQSIAMLPGSEIIVNEGAACVLGQGYNIYLYSAKDWAGKGFVYGRLGTVTGNVDVSPLPYIPGKPTDVPFHTADKDARIYIAGTIDATQGFVYMTESGVQIEAAEGAIVRLGKRGTNTKTYQVQQGDSATYVEIKVNSLTLGENDNACGGTYEYINGEWVKTSCTHTPGTNATCTEAQKCTVCGIELKAALGHDYKAVVTEPTCTEDGYTTHTCSRCGDSYTDSKVDAFGHTAGADATCDTAQVCTVCGETLKAELGHTEVIDAAVAPTCTATGLTEGKHCSVCNKVLVAQEVVDALGHTAGAGATCTTAQTCTVCGTELNKALGHTEVVDAAVAPTCTATGLTEGKHCSVCGEVLVAQEEVAALGHTEVVDKAVDATCTETGLTEGKHCSVCGTVTVAQEVVGALGHTSGDVVVENNIDPTCTIDGKYDNVTYCTVCNKETGRTTINVPKSGHKDEDKNNECDVCKVNLCGDNGHIEVTDAAVDATCTATGLTEGKHCGACGHVIVAQEVVDALGHTEVVDAAKAPTCTETGLTEGKHCSVCGEVLVAQKEVAANGHSYNSVVTDPTCTDKGYTTYTCSVCGDSYVANEVAALGHTEVIDYEVIADCYNKGLTEGKHCSVCNEILVKQEVVDYAHRWVTIEAKAPTRTENGYEEYHGCEQCGETTDIVVIPALGEASINNYDDFIYNLALLEEIANEYVKQYPAKDPAGLVIKYIRTGVERYNSGSWGIMAGYEDADFAKYVTKMENLANAQVTDGNYVAVTGLKNLTNFTLPNGDKADIGHVFGSMDITYHNGFGLNHADVSGWAGDLVDLLEASAANRVNGSLDEMIKIVGEKYFLSRDTGPLLPTFSKEDYDGDLDAYYIMNVLKSVEYGVGDSEDEYSLTEIFMNYMTEDLTAEYRAAYFMTNRLNTTGTRAQVRNAVYTEYLSNKLISTLEGTRDLTGTKDLVNLRRAVCYAFADYICKLAGDYVDSLTNKYYTTFSSTTTELAPGIVQETHMATTADGKQMVYHLATADITRDDVHIFANYNNNDPAAGWAMQRVLDQANAAQNKYGDPDSEYYVPNYNVIAAVNGAGFNMSTGEPGGLLVMGGVEYHAVNANGFFGILKDGTPVIGTTEEYNTIYKDQVQEAIAGFATTLIKDGEICVSEGTNYTSNRAPRTAVGITKTGKVVFMVFDGRQEPYSCGGSYVEIAQVLRDAGCVEAVNLDGGGSSTFVARQPGASELSVLNSPSDGFQRSVSTSWMIVSTAPSSTEFDHANITSEYAYSTIGTPVEMNAKGISPAGNETELPEGYTWAVSDDRFASISADGVFTGKRNGTVEVYMMLDGEVIGMTTMNVVVPENVYFTRTHMDAVYGANTVLPIAASYNNKPVAFNMGDITFTTENSKAGTFNGNVFVGNEISGVKVVKVTACLTKDASVSGSITLNMFKQGENTFDFSMATGGDREFAWLRDITNSTTFDNITYTVVDVNEDMTTSYVFAIDMTQIPIPSQLADLVYMLPGADLENATAWNFLLQLAERVSVLTEISAVIDFDDDLDVDISELKVLNEYFSLTDIILDETTNTVTLKLNWIDQTKAIDPATANPLCMVNGIKLTPKDNADWGASDRLSVINSGTLSYNAYLRANALYSFALKPENQEIYGLTPFINPNIPSESGASFGATYKTFEDSYTLVKEVKDGWTIEDGGFAYYQDGNRLTGVNKIDGYYYDFGENGSNKDQTVFTGVFFDKTSDVYRYAEFGVLVSGWRQIGEDWHYFNPKTMAAQTGTYALTGAIVYKMDETGKVIKGVWHKTAKGTRYYYGPDYYRSYHSWAQTWVVIDGDRYCFNSQGYVLTGIQLVTDRNDQTFADAYDCGVDGKNPTRYTGIIGNHYYSNGGMIKAYQLVKHDGYYYYISNYHKILKDTTAYIEAKYMNGATDAYGNLLPSGKYEFDSEGRMIIPEPKNGPQADGYFYINNVKQKGWKVYEYEGNYYYVASGNKYYVSKRVYLDSTVLAGIDLPAGWYEIDAEGKVIVPPPKNGPQDDGYFYIDSVVQKGWKVYEYEGNYYYVASGNKYYVSKRVYLDSNVLSGTGLSVGWYEIGSDGKIIIAK